MLQISFFNAVENGHFDDVYLPQNIGVVALMLFLSVATMFSYIVYMECREGKKFSSISDLAYKWGRLWYWAAFVWEVALLFAPALFMATNNRWDITSHVFVTSLLFIGILPLSRNDRKSGRTVLGVSACILSQVLVAVIQPQLFAVWIIMGLLVVLSETRISNKRCFPECLDGKGILISEILCILSFYGAVFCNLLKVWRYGY